MAKSKKKATEMTDKELLRSLFPKEVREALKQVVKQTRKKKKPKK